MQYYAIPSNTMQYHAMPCNTMQCHDSLITADGAYHCPVGSIRPFFILTAWQDINFCGPEKENCVSAQSLKDKECLVPCSGLYADIADGSLEKEIVKGL